MRGQMDNDLCGWCNLPLDSSDDGLAYLSCFCVAHSNCARNSSQAADAHNNIFCTSCGAQTFSVGNPSEQQSDFTQDEFIPFNNYDNNTNNNNPKQNQIQTTKPPQIQPFSKPQSNPNNVKQFLFSLSNLSFNTFYMTVSEQHIWLAFRSNDCGTTSHTAWDWHATRPQPTSSKYVPSIRPFHWAHSTSISISVVCGWQHAKWAVFKAAASPSFGAVTIPTTATTCRCHGVWIHSGPTLSMLEACKPPPISKEASIVLVNEYMKIKPKRKVLGVSMSYANPFLDPGDPDRPRGIPCLNCRNTNTAFGYIKKQETKKRDEQGKPLTISTADWVCINKLVFERYPEFPCVACPVCQSSPELMDKLWHQCNVMKAQGKAPVFLRPNYEGGRRCEACPLCGFSPDNVTCACRYTQFEHAQKQIIWF